MTPILFSMPGNDRLAGQLGKMLAWEIGSVVLHRFPDGESYVRFLTTIHGRDIAFVCALDRPDEKIMALYFTARIARELGARRIGLIAPYLAYMRQDAIFREGEGLTSAHFAKFVGSCVDWLVTVDPHLHRHHDLREIYAIPAKVVHAAPDISQWIGRNVHRPLVIGPDSESEQWAAEVAKGAGCPYTVLQKTRRADRDVEVYVPDTTRWRDHTPVLVDDIVSTARTMIAATSHLHAAGFAPPVCVAVHPIFAGDAYAALQAAGVAKIVSCNTIAHPTNMIDLSRPLAAAVHHWTSRGARLEKPREETRPVNSRLARNVST